MHATPPPSRASANRSAVKRLREADPVLVDVQRALDVVPGMTPDTILTSGAQLDWPQYTGGQARAIAYAAIFEGLAADMPDAAAKLRAGHIKVRACHDHSCVGSVAGVYTASMPVLVVENAANGNRGFCNFYEGDSRRRLNYGSYDADVHRSLCFVRDVIAPTLGAAIRRGGGLPLKPIMKRALHMGDELHSRNAAATLLFARAVTPMLLELALDGAATQVRQVLQALAGGDYFFLRVGMAAAKAIADSAHGIEGASIVTAMAWNCREFAIRVSGLGDTWFRGSLPTVQARFFEGFSMADLEWIGGESVILETVGFGAFAQAAAFPLQSYQGGSAEAMVQMNLAMYRISADEHPDYQIPYLAFRGTPIGIDIARVVETSVVPLCDVGLAGRSGGQIGAGVLTPPLDCFVDAWKAFGQRYPDSNDGRPLNVQSE
ncbi:MAG: DUF1116 domain-containing protein [Alphaproteobacteria bacterium]|nr:DUF1116 domain-containing protein [Alphaproteobacteria bacterium]